MELWQEMRSLERINKSRNGEWLDLIKKKADRLEAAKASTSPRSKKPKSTEAANPQKPSPKRIAKQLRKEKLQKRAARNLERKRQQQLSAQLTGLASAG